MTFNEYLEMTYGISSEDLTDDDYDALYAEYASARDEMIEWKEFEGYVEKHGFPVIDELPFN